ncbi:MAG: hypothetical protein IAI50_18460 [Candidatus Eremiobacteraeota bacterium]|nr:hypothetical protein [Candidatus Eremiobacteraeota bacterium]
MSTTGRRARIAAIFALCVIFFRGSQTVDAQSSPFKNSQKIFGPLAACAMDSAYHEWLNGPLNGVIPDASAFTSSVNATKSPYAVSFSATSGHTLPTGSYSIPASNCVDASWPAVPAPQIYPQGPLTLSGAYTRAIIAADEAHVQLKQSLQDAYAFMSSPGGGIDIATLLGTNDTIIVSYYQFFVQTGPTRGLGCYKQQQFIVDPSTFIAAKTTIGCPG